MPGRERERDSPDSRSALVESKAGKRQKPAPCPFPAGAFSTLARTGRYEIGFFAYLHAQGSVKDAMCNLRNIANAAERTNPGTGFTVFTFLPCSTNIALQFIWG